MLAEVKNFHPILQDEPPCEIHNLFFPYTFKDRIDIRSQLWIFYHLRHQDLPGSRSIRLGAMGAFQLLLTIKPVRCAQRPLLHHMKDLLYIQQLPALLSNSIPMRRNSSTSMGMSNRFEL